MLRDYGCLFLTEIDPPGVDFVVGGCILFDKKRFSTDTEP